MNNKLIFIKWLVLVQFFLVYPINISIVRASDLFNVQEKENYFNLESPNPDNYFSGKQGIQSFPASIWGGKESPILFTPPDGMEDFPGLGQDVPVEDGHSIVIPLVIILAIAYGLRAKKKQISHKIKQHQL